MGIFSKKDTISDIMKTSPVPVKEIYGSYLPNHKLCHNEKQNGKETNLNTSYIQKETQNLQDLRRQLQETLYEIREKQENLKNKKTPIEKMNAQLKKEYLSILVSTYKTLISEEMKAGMIRIPCIYTVHDHTANVKSNNGNFVINSNTFSTSIIF